MSRHLRVAPSLSLVLLLALSGCMGIGKAGADLETGTPDVSVELSLDSDSYGVGAPIKATLELKNLGKIPIAVGRPSVHTVDFFIKSDTSAEPRNTEIVSWPFDTPDFVTIDPGKSDRRMFALNRATGEPGDYTLFAVYRTEPEETIELSTTVASNPVPLQITLPVVMERDGVGLITEAQARKIAQEHFEQSFQRTDARLVQDTEMKVYQWWVTVYFDSPTADGETSGSCFINPYLGHVWKETDHRVDMTLEPGTSTPTP